MMMMWELLMIAALAEAQTTVCPPRMLQANKASTGPLAVEGTSMTNATANAPEMGSLVMAAPRIGGLVLRIAAACTDSAALVASIGYYTDRYVTDRTNTGAWAAPSRNLPDMADNHTAGPQLHVELVPLLAVVVHRHLARLKAHRNA
jgi:hypothetical protein